MLFSILFCNDVKIFVGAHFSFLLLLVQIKNLRVKQQKNSAVISSIYKY